MKRQPIWGCLAILGTAMAIGAPTLEKQSFELPGPGRAITVSGRLGQPGSSWVMSLADAAGKPQATLSLSSSDPLEAAMDVKLVLPGQGQFVQRYFIRPDLKFYVDESRRKRFIFSLADQTAFDEQRQVADKYHLFTSVYEHRFSVRLERTDAGFFSAWLDGRFLGTVTNVAAAVVGTIAFAAEAGAPVVAEVPSLWNGPYLPVELNHYARPGSLTFPSQPTNLPAGTVGLVAGIPMLADAMRGRIDVGISRWLEEKIDPADFCDTDTTRSAFDGNPESIILRLPKENFVAAHLLCVVEPDPAKVPALTLRLTRFGNHYGDSGGRTDQAIGDTAVVFPTNPATDGLPAGMRIIGEVEVGRAKRGRWATTREPAKLPLYLVSVPLKTGAVSDLLGEDAPEFGRRNDHWDLELTREIRTAVQFFNLQSCRIKPLGLPSAVHVIGLTLERSPVDVTVSASVKGNVFYAAEQPAFDVALVNRQEQPAAITVACAITDYDGRKSERRVTVQVPGRHANGGRAQTRIPLNMESLGYFDAVVTATLADGREIWREPTSFALLPPDTRQAGDESPFGAWWFVGSHGGCKRLDWMGPLLMRLGMRHCCPGPFAAAELKPYKLSYSMANWPKAKREAMLEKHPEIRFGMLFHEKSIPDTTAVPPELLGQPRPELTPRGREAFDRYRKEAEEAAAWYREKHPGVKLSFGNSPSGISLWFMREGWPKQWVDCFAMEGVGAWMTPECPPRRGALQEVWFLSEMRKLYGYEEIPVSSGYEYITRCSQPGALTEREQAEYHVRDAIHALAYGYPSINIGLTDDSADSYYSTIYAASGFLRRNPLLTPKPGFVMYATMTLRLDGAKYVQALDTGSRGLYALEFQRGDRTVYPVWTVRGKRDLNFRCKGGPVLLTDAMGNTRELPLANGRVTVPAATAPVYLVTTSPVEVEAAGRPEYTERPPEPAAPVDAFADPSGWTVDAGRDAYLESYAADQLYTQGVFAVRAVVDDAKGACTEVEMQPQPGVPDLFARYVSLSLQTPVTLDREVSRIGMWVKGNACWGRVFWEFEDAKGERYFSASNENSGWDVSDWRSRSSINFDDWCFVSLTVPRRYPGGYHGPNDRDWSYSGGDGDGIVQHPITVRRVVVALRDRQVYVDRMVDARSRSVRLSGLMAGD